MIKKLLTAQVVASYALFFQLSLHHGLRGNTGMIGTRKPQGLFTGHTIVAYKNILQGMVQHMTQRQTSGNVGWRHKHRIGFFALIQNTGTLGMKTPDLFPVFTSPSLLNIVMVITFFKIKCFGMIAHDILARVSPFFQVRDVSQK